MQTSNSAAGTEMVNSNNTAGAGLVNNEKWVCGCGHTNDGGRICGNCGRN